MENVRGLHERRTGFSLIELMVTILVLTVLLGVGLASFTQFQQRQLVQQTAEDIQQIFAQTRKSAQQKDQSGCTNSTYYVPIDWYRVEIVDNQHLERSKQCNDGGSFRKVIDEDYSLPAGVTIVSPSSFPYQVDYLPLTAQTTVSTSMIIVEGKGGVKYGFSIHSGGLIGSVEKQ